MGYRILQLQYEPLVKEAKIVEGYEMWLELSPLYQNAFGRDKDAIIESSYTPGGKRTINCVHDYQVHNLGDGFKKITLWVSDIEVKEECGILLMVGVGAGRVEADYGKRISGRYGEDGIFELLPDDKIKVHRGESFSEEFVAIKFQKQMYLIKKHRE